MSREEGIRFEAVLLGVPSSCYCSSCLACNAELLQSPGLLLAAFSLQLRCATRRSFVGSRAVSTSLSYLFAHQSVECWVVGLFLALDFAKFPLGTVKRISSSFESCLVPCFARMEFSKSRKRDDKLVETATLLSEKKAIQTGSSKGSPLLYLQGPK